MRKLLILALSAALAGTAFAYTNYVSKVPNGNVFSCNTCHDEGKMKNDFKNNGNVWNATLAHKDSDNDGASNGVELQDPDGVWKEGQPNPHRNGWNTYNPDNGGNTPPYAPVEPASFGRVKAMYK